MTSVLVSVIVPVFNRSHLIRRTLDSVHAQHHRPIQVIVINDGSEDDSEAVILDWTANHAGPEFEIIYVNQQNQGAPKARNTGLEYAKGAYIQFLDSDDLLEPQKISEQVRRLLSSDSDLAVCDFVYADSAGRVVREGKNSGNLRLKVARGGSLSVFAPLMSRSLLERGVQWDETLQRNQDVDLISKVLFLARNYVYTPGRWCIYVEHDQPRISDVYGRSKPEFGKRMRSAVRFFSGNFRNIPFRNHPYILLMIAHLAYYQALYAVVGLLTKET